jgi:aspartate/methionine/tyrosine aminotransferase
MQFLRKTLDQAKSPVGEVMKLKDLFTGNLEILDLTQGIPNYFPSTLVKKQISKDIKENTISLYTEREGLKELRELFANEISRIYESKVLYSNILITNGCNNAFAITILTLFEKNDEIILPVPYYFNHQMFLEMEGIKIRYLDTCNTNYVPNVQFAKKLINSRTKAIFLVNPINPTGAEIPSHIITEFFDLCVKENILLIIDETYKNFISKDNHPHYIFNNKNWRKHFISLHSMSKDYALCGYRIGAIVCDDIAITEMLKVSECLSVSSSHIGQKAAVACLKLDKNYMLENMVLSNKKTEYLKNKMDGLIDYFQLDSAGIFFGWIKHKFNLPTSEIVKQLIINSGILTLPGNLFLPYENNYLRISYSKLNNLQIDDLANRLKSFKINCQNG